MSMFHTHTARTGVALGIALLALTGCSASTPAATETQQESTASAAQEASSVTIENAWVKSAEAGGMSGAFGTLHNAGDADATVVAVESAAASMAELHEVVDGKMQEKDGGFVIPAGGTFELAPGGNHLMLMELPSALAAGEDVTFTLTFSDGSTLEFTAMVKDYSGANEEYGDLEHGDSHEDGEGAEAHSRE